MNRARMVLAEAIRSLTTNLSTTVAATMTVLIGMFLLGLVMALGTWVLSYTDSTKNKLLVKTYFCTPLTCDAEATEAQITEARVALLRMPEVRSVRFVSKEEALEIMRKRNPELTENLTSNPFPPSLEIRTRRAEQIPVVGRRLERQLPPGVEKVNWGEKTANRVLDVAKVISGTFLVAVAVLLAASTLLIANTIRLSIFSRRREIEVMKLVGATNWFVRGPFMLEGLLCGVVGAATAVLLLLLGKELALPAILGRVDAGSDVQAIAFAWNAAILIAAGLLLGAAGSGLTLRKFLKV